MKFEEFVEEIIENMQKRVPENYLVQVQNICKNNDLKLTGLTIGDQKLNIYPTIYLEEFYKKYEEGVSFETITDIIWNTYCQNAPKSNWDTSRFIEWRNVKDIICPKIINYAANRELLNSVPYRKVCDLAVVYYAVVDICENGVASILLRNEHLKLWGKTEADLYELALENYRRIFSITSRNLDDIILELMNCKEDISFDENTIVPMIVVTNNKKLNGAAAILFPDELQKIADKMGADLYILPSSVHESATRFAA
ncbi:MAG: DUF5688 family protein [Roseburia inulinivorans]|nr:DUF5688 family protein [Roseburia inulinivorans]